MKILQIINTLGAGGAEKLIELMVPLMNEKEKIQVDILMLNDKADVYGKMLKRRNVNIHVINYNHLYDPRHIIKIIQHIKKGDYDVVHSHTFPTQYWVAIASLFFKGKDIKFITTEHSTHNKRREKSLVKPLEKMIYAQYDHIITISDVAQGNLLNWLSPREKKLENFLVIENGIDLDRIRTAEPYEKEEIINAKNIDENTIFICMVGRFSKQKSQPILIRAIKKLPEDYHLILMGAGSLMNKNIQLAKDLDVSDRVHFLGFRSDMERVLKTSDIIVLSTQWEGLSLASIEALASGKPFIASNVMGVKEVVQDKGLLFEEGNVNELVSHILALRDNSKLYNQVVQRSLAASEKYDINQMVTQLIDLYHS